MQKPAYRTGISLRKTLHELLLGAAALLPALLGKAAQQAARRRPSQSRMPALGSCIVWHNQALHLLPQFYVANALLKAGHVAEQAVWRSASLHAQLLWCPCIRSPVCHS